jgi:hypothetical protein
MGFENHNRTGLLERASKIAVKFHVVYNATFYEFRGDTDNVRKATAALEKWAHAERASYRRQDL